MTTNTELEIKFIFDAAVAQSLAREGYSPLLEKNSQVLRATYFDTPQGDLAQAHVALRVRHADQGYVQTVKAQGGAALERWQHEQGVAGPLPERRALPPASTALGDLLHGQFDALEAQFSVRFRRSVWRIQAAPLLVLEISVDQGELRAKPGTRKAPIAELEIECIRGTRLAFLRWATQFAVRHQLRLLQDSKQEQGLRLLGRLPAVPPPALRARSALRDSFSAGQACAVALQADVMHLLANAAALRSGQEPEAVHQLHIAMQRLRATVRAFGLSSHGRSWRALLAQAHALARTAGQARDADVFATQSLPAVRESFGAEPALQAFADLVATQRALCTQRCQQAFGGPAVTAFALTLLCQSERVAQRSAKGPCAKAKANTGLTLRMPVRPFLQIQLRHLARRMRRRIRQAHSPKGWHRARLAVKRLRYTLELAWPTLGAAKRHARILQLLTKLQQDLGEMNDQTMACRTARRIVALADTAQRQAADCVRAIALVDAWSAQNATPVTLALVSVQKTCRRLERWWRKRQP